MSLRPSDLPDYARPPVNEVVIGLSFAKLRLNQVHIGLLWSTVRDRYPSQQDTVPTQTVLEAFDEPLNLEAVDLEELPLRRSWFIGKEPQWLLQIQENRLVHNWRRLNPTDVYPHFEECLARFMYAWSALDRLCEAEQLPAADIQIGRASCRERV